MKILGIFALLIVLSGCAGIAPKSDSVKVNLSDMTMLPSTLLEQRFQVKLRIQNRSQTALHIDGISFDLELNDKDFASGVSNEGMTIDKLSEGVLTVDMTSTLFGLIRQLQSVQELESKPFRYEISGTVYSDSGVFGIPFSEQGEIDLSKAAAK